MVPLSAICSLHIAVENSHAQLLKQESFEYRKPISARVGLHSGTLLAGRRRVKRAKATSSFSNRFEKRNFRVNLPTT